MNAIYQLKVPADGQAAFFARSQVHWDRVRVALFTMFPAFLTAAPFVSGDAHGEDDFHLMAWLTRIASLVGATTGEEWPRAFEKVYGVALPEAVVEYWIVRPSWKKVYANGLDR